MNDTFSVDVNVTTSCNLKCDYCFVGGKAESFKDVSKISSFLNRLIQSKLFLENYKMLSVNFWGGEPTLDTDFIKGVIESLEGIGSIRFFIYSNGVNIKKIEDLLLKYRDIKVGNHSKLVIQISYDGEPIHSKFRGETEAVWTTLHWLDLNNVPFTIKSTMPYDGFKYMYDAYLDIKKLISEFRWSGIKINYFPTIEHYNHLSEDMPIDKRLIQKYEEDLKYSLVKIAKKELEDKTNIFKWFTNSRAMCTAGKDLITIDCDGGVYPCHGCLYEDKKNHGFGNIEDPEIMDKILAFRQLFSDALERGMCKDCGVSFCLRCNHAKFVYSKKEYYFDKWLDGDSQKDLCRFYNINNRVKTAFEEIKRRTL